MVAELLAKKREEVCRKQQNNKFKFQNRILFFQKL